MRSKRGFTLLEVVVALTILALGLSALITLFPLALKANRRAKNYTMAGILAHRVLGEAAFLGYDEIGQMSGLNPANFPLGEGGNPESVGTGKTNFPDTANYEEREYQYGLSVAYEEVGLYKLMLAIYWTDGAETKEAEFVTFLADYDD